MIHQIRVFGGCCIKIFRLKAGELLLLELLVMLCWLYIFYVCTTDVIFRRLKSM